MASEDDKKQEKTKEKEDEVRCNCGALVARQTPEGVELFCRRCKRPMIVRDPTDKWQRVRGVNR